MTELEERESANDFVTESMRRGSLLELLYSEPRDARTLADQLNMSRSTVHRTTETLGDLGLIDKPDAQFELTGLGTIVAEEFRQYRRNLETANRLGPFLNTIDTTAVDVPLEHFADATVTRARERHAHVGVKRIIELIERTDSVRMMSGIISPLYVDVARREILNGTDIEVIFDVEVLEIIASQFMTEARDALETGRFHVLAGEAVPFELFLFDDRIGMAAHDESGIARAFVETSSTEALTWAANLYRDYADAADPIDLV